MLPTEFTVQFEVKNLLTESDQYPQKTATINYINDCESASLAFTFNGCDDESLGDCAALDPVRTYDHYVGYFDVYDEVINPFTPDNYGVPGEENWYYCHLARSFALVNDAENGMPIPDELATLELCSNPLEHNELCNDDSRTPEPHQMSRTRTVLAADVQSSMTIDYFIRVTLTVSGVVVDSRIAKIQINVKNCQAQSTGAVWSSEEE